IKRARQENRFALLHVFRCELWVLARFSGLGGTMLPRWEWLLGLMVLGEMVWILSSLFRREEEDQNRGPRPGPRRGSELTGRQRPAATNLERFLQEVRRREGAKRQEGPSRPPMPNRPSRPKARPEPVRPTLVPSSAASPPRVIPTAVAPAVISDQEAATLK